MGYMAEKAAYIRGLAEGLDINKDTKEGKLLLAIIDILQDASDAIDEIEEVCDELGNQIDEIDEDLSDLEDYVYGQDFEEDEDFDLESFDCPNCGETIVLDADLLSDEEESIICPNCNHKIELECECDCCDFDDEE